MVSFPSDRIKNSLRSVGVEKKGTLSGQIILDRNQARRNVVYTARSSVIQLHIVGVSHGSMTRIPLLAFIAQFVTACISPHTGLPANAHMGISPSPHRFAQSDAQIKPVPPNAKQCPRSEPWTEHRAAAVCGFNDIGVPNGGEYRCWEDRYAECVVRCEFVECAPGP